MFKKPSDDMLSLNINLENKKGNGYLEPIADAARGAIKAYGEIRKKENVEKLYRYDEIETRIRHEESFLPVKDYKL